MWSPYEGLNMVMALLSHKSSDMRIGATLAVGLMNNGIVNPSEDLALNTLYAQLSTPLQPSASMYAAAQYSASLLALGLYAFPAEAFALIPLIRMNLAIGAVNLLPALPLDGGRALCALMALRMDRHRAVRIGVILGRVLAAGILLFTGFLCLSGERLQLGLVLSAVYIIASGERERRQSEGATLRAMLLKPDMPETPAPVRWIAISETATVLDAVREMRPGHTHLFAVMNASGGVQTVLTQALIMAAVERDSTSPLSSLIA